MTQNNNPPRLKVRLKAAKKRSQSSRSWLERQLNDPYVHRAREEGYRSRAAYKLREIQEKFQLIRSGDCVVDLGAAPGGWTQVALEFAQGGCVVGIDLIPIEPIQGAILLQGDFTENQTLDDLMRHLPDTVDVVLSDMAASACGIPSVDHIRIMYLVELTLDFAQKVLKPGGHLVAKVLRGGTENQLLIALKKSFKKVVHFKPPASRKDSAEMYVIAMDFQSSGSSTHQ